MSIKKKVGIIGCGNMGGAILYGALESGILSKDDVYVYDINPAMMEKASGWGVHLSRNDEDVCQSADLILLAVKPQNAAEALAQCKKYLQDNFPDSLIEEATLSTSSAVKSLQTADKSVAAIGSLDCAEMYHVPVIDTKINDEVNNQTRFILLAKFMSPQTGHDKTSITFSTENKAGALNKILTILENYEINMSYIDSRPSKKELGEYVFYIDFEGHILDRKIAKAFEEIMPLVKMFYVIGSYHSVD